MIDEDAIKRRERIFDQLRESESEYVKLNTECDEISHQLSDLRKQTRTKRDDIEKLIRLIKIMILHDCCPVEAQLKYSDELENDRDINEDSQKATKNYSPLQGSMQSQVGWI